MMVGWMRCVFGDRLEQVRDAFPKRNLRGVHSGPALFVRIVANSIAALRIDRFSSDDALRFESRDLAPTICSSELMAASST